MFKGLTGEILRPAACGLIEKLSLSKLPCPEQDTIGVYLLSSLIHIFLFYGGREWAGMGDGGKMRIKNTKGYKLNSPNFLWP